MRTLTRPSWRARLNTDGSPEADEARTARRMVQLVPAMLDYDPGKRPVYQQFRDKAARALMEWRRSQ